MNVENPASRNALFQVCFEKKCVKPIVKATKFGTSRKCSIIIILAVGLQTRLHSFKNSIFSTCVRISCAADNKKIKSTEFSFKGIEFETIYRVFG